MKQSFLISILTILFALTGLLTTSCTPRQTVEEPQSPAPAATEEAPAQTNEAPAQAQAPEAQPAAEQEQRRGRRGDRDENRNNPPAEAIYFIMVDRFFNGDVQAPADPTIAQAPADPADWHGGNLKGIREKLSYLQSLGITKIWLSPIYSAAHEKFFGNGAFHGYWTYDLNKVDPNFGDENDFKELAKAAKDLGIEIILDLVVNHVGYGAPLLEQKPNWFHPALTIEDWNDPDQLVNRQVHGLPDLDQSNPEVYAYITNAAWKWLAMPNVAGFRLDAVKHVDINFWSRFNKELKSGKRNIMLIGEYFDGDPKKVDDIQKNGQFTQMFDFPLSFALRDVFCEQKSLAALASVITNDRQYSSANDMVTFIDNHDMPRFISLCHNDEDSMARALRVMLAWRGIPSIYYGTEVPLAGEKEPDNRADMDFSKAYMYPVIQSALRMRTRHPVFAKGATSTLHYQPGFAVFARELEDEQALILVNQTSDTQHYTLPAGKWRDAESRRMITAMANVRPNSVQILINNHADQPIIKTELKKITFKVPNDGHTYAIAGSAPELGTWNPANAPKTTTEITIELPAQTVVTYKPVRANSDGSFSWADGDNRELFTEKASTVDITW